MSAPEHERYIYLYASSLEEKLHYVKLAEEAGMPLSKFLLSRIEEALAEKPSNRPGIREIEGLREKVTKLQEEVRRKDAELQQARALVERQKNLAFIDDDAEVLELNARLIDVIQTQGPIFETRLLEVLGIEPNDLQSLRAISIQLEFLERHGKIRKSPRGWRWMR